MALSSSSARLRQTADDLPHSISLRRWSALTPRLIVIGASTGGPQALTLLLRELAPSLASIPVVVVLHMPPDFVAPMCEDMARLTGLPTGVAAHGTVLQPGHVYFAGGPAHCRIFRLGDETIFADCDTPPVNFCKPAVDVLFRSAAESFGAGVLGIVLTGMGHDGLAGSEAIASMNGSVVAQDEASSVVWGMPGAVARAGLCSAVLPLTSLAGTIASCLRGNVPKVRP